MSLFRHVRALLEVRAPTNEPQTGTTWLLLATDPDTEPRLDLRVWVQPEPEPTVPLPPECEASAPIPPPNNPGPQAEVIVETSVDRVVWMPVHVPFVLRDRPALSPAVVLGPYVRARTLSHGQPHTAHVKLLGNASFKLEPA